MGMISTVTIGSDTFSVYALTADPVADATTHFNGMLGSRAAAWTAATADDQKRALAMASDWIDRASRFSGEESAPPQPRSHPRDGATCDGDAIPDGTVPDELALAGFDLAGLLLEDAAAADSSGQGSNVRSVKAGSAAVEFFRPTIGTTADHRLPQFAHDRIRCLLEGAGGISGATSFGTECESHFDDEDYGLTEGYA